MSDPVAHRVVLEGLGLALRQGAAQLPAEGVIAPRGGAPFGVRLADLVALGVVAVFGPLAQGVDNGGEPALVVGLAAPRTPLNQFVKEHGGGLDSVAQGCANPSQIPTGGYRK